MWITNSNTDNHFVASYRRLSELAHDVPVLTNNPQNAQAFIEEWETLTRLALRSANLFGLRLLILKLQKIITNFPEWQTVLLYYQGQLNLITSQNTKAEQSFQQQYELAQQRNEPKAICLALLGLAESFIAQLQFNKAEAVLEKSLAICPQKREDWDNAILWVQVYNQFGRLYHLRKQWQLSENTLLKALELVRQLSQPGSLLLAREEAFCYRWLGINCQPRRRWDKAEHYLEISLNLSHHSQDVLGVVEAKIQLGAVYYQKGHYDTALICFEGGLAISEQLGYLPMIAQAFYYKGRAYLATGKKADALEMAQKALETGLSLNQAEAISRAYHFLGQIYNNMGRHEKALENYLKALEMFNPQSYYPQWVELLVEAGDFLLSLPDKNGYWEQALECYRRAIDLVEAEEKLDYLATLMGRMGRAFTRLKGLDGVGDAMRCYRLQLRLAGDLDSPDLPVAEAVALRLEAFMGMQRCSALQSNRNLNPTADPLTLYFEANQPKRLWIEPPLALG
jgi:tetratricopeptide (TPR) repeat protein